MLVRSVMMVSGLIAAVVSGLARGDDGSTATFRFDPCLGEATTFVQTVATRRDKDFGEHGRTVDESTTVTEVRVRRVDGGFVVTATPVASEMKRDGAVLDNPFVKAVQAVEMTVTLDPDGRLVEISGIAEFIDGVMAELPEEARASVAKLVNADMLVARETAEWSGRIGDFVGATVAVGDTWESEAPFQLPSGGEIPFWTTVTFNASDGCGSCGCLEVATDYTSDPSAIADLVTETVEGVVGSAGGAGAFEISDRIHGSSSRIIDPNTMRIYAERMERTITMRVHQPGLEPFPMTMTEVRVYELEYPDEYCGRGE